MKRSSLSMVLFFVIFTFSSCLPIPVPVNSDYTGGSVGDQVEEVSPAIVAIDCISPESALMLFVMKQMGLKMSADLAINIEMTHGSGFIISEDGHVMTNSHVIPKGWIVQITLKDGRSFKVTEVVHDEKNDMALLQIPGENFPYVEVAGMAPRAGDFLFAVTRPMFWDFSVKTGVVSHPYREIRPDVYNMQMTLPVNPGDSGSPVFNYRGEVVGIARAYVLRVNAISLAVPWKKVVKGIKTLKADLVKMQEATKVIKEMLPKEDSSTQSFGEIYDRYSLLPNQGPLLDSLR